MHANNPPLPVTICFNIILYNIKQVAIAILADMYNSAGAIANSNSFIEYIWPIVVTNITCTGSEESLLQCTFSTEAISSCNYRRDASVICQSKSPNDWHGSSII